jgi:hypothetical protein
VERVINKSSPTQLDYAAPSTPTRPVPVEVWLALAAHLLAFAAAGFAIFALRRLGTDGAFWSVAIVMPVSVAFAVAGMLLLILGLIRDQGGRLSVITSVLALAYWSVGIVASIA